MILSYLTVTCLFSLIIFLLFSIVSPPLFPTHTEVAFIVIRHHFSYAYLAHLILINHTLVNTYQRFLRRNGKKDEKEKRRKCYR